MSPQTYERELGGVQVTLAQMEKKLEKAEADSKEHRETVNANFDEIRGSLHKLNTRFDRIDGAWKATTVIAAIIGAASTFIWKAAIWLLSMPIPK